MENKPTPPKTQGLNFFGKHSELILGIAGTVILAAIIFYIVSVGSSQKANDELINEQADWHMKGYETGFQDGLNSSDEEVNILDRVYGDTQEEAPVEIEIPFVNYAEYVPENFPEFPVIKSPEGWGGAKVKEFVEQYGFSEELYFGLAWGVDSIVHSISVQNIDGAKVKLSFNAIYGCEYYAVDKTWNIYSEIGVSSNKCNPSVKSINGVTAYGFSTQALGAYSYSYSIITKDGSYLFTIFRHLDVPASFSDEYMYVDIYTDEQQVKELAEQDTLTFINANPELFLPQ